MTQRASVLRADGGGLRFREGDRGGGGQRRRREDLSRGWWVAPEVFEVTAVREGPLDGWADRDTVEWRASDRERSAVEEPLRGMKEAPAAVPTGARLEDLVES